MSSLVHKFEKQVLRTDKSGFNSVDNYTIQISSTADDSLYDLYNSYLELTVENTLASSDTAISYPVQLKPIVQPSGMVKVSNVEYQYVDTNNQVQTFTVADQSQYVPNARAVVSMLLDSKSLHEQYAGLTEWKYNTEHNSNKKDLWDDTIPVASAGTLGRYKIRLPFRDIIPACNGPSFINLKSLKIDLSWIEPSEFFETNSDGTYVYIDKDKNVKKVNCSNWSIIRCECTTSIYLGNISQIDPSLRGLQNTVIKHDIIKMKSGDTEYCNGISVPFKTSYLVLYMTNKYGNHRTPLEKYIKELRCYLSGCVESYKTNSDASSYKDNYWYYILSHCVAEGREYEPLINYQNWLDRFNFVVLPLNEMCPQAAANYWNFQLQLHNKVGTDGEQLHLLWLKEGEEEVNN